MADQGNQDAEAASLPENPQSEASPQKAEPKDEKPKRRRRIIRRKDRSSRQQANTIPAHILQNTALQSAIKTSLPSDYEFEINKSVWKIESTKSRHVALQMPEGLLMYACAIGDILRNFCADLTTVSVLGDVTYGACCVDDLGAKALGADLLVHYGHSCLVPLNATEVPCLYVFVEIRVDVNHLVECFCKTCPAGTRVHVMGTVQVRLFKTLNHKCSFLDLTFSLCSFVQQLQHPPKH